VGALEAAPHAAQLTGSWPAATSPARWCAATHPISHRRHAAARALAPHEPQHVPHEGLALGFVGRLVPQKGLDILLQALALQRGMKWRLTIVGDGPERERLERLASELRLAARVRWTAGCREQVANLWPDLDVLVQPSLALRDWREANGHILIEAMANEVAFWERTVA